MAQLLECSERTVHRDLRTVELAGVPIWFDHAAGGYRLRFGDSLTASLRASPQQNLPLASPKKQDTGHLPSRPIHSEAAKRLTRERIELVQRSIANCRLMAGTYRSPYEKDPITTQWQPLHLLTHRDIPYLIARDVSLRNPDEDALRTYRLHRFESLESTQSAAAASVRFSLDDYLRGAWRIYRGCPPTQVVLRTRTPDRVVTDLTHPSARFVELADGETEITLTVGLSPDFLRWLLARLDVVAVAHPPLLRERLAKRVQAISGSLNATTSGSEITGD